MGSTTTTSSSNPILLLVCATGICFCYLSYGIILEKLNSNPATLHITTFLLFTQSINNAVCSFLLGLLVQSYEVIVSYGSAKKEKQSRIAAATEDIKHSGVPLNHRLLFTASFCYFAAMTATNEALAYVSYPSATLAKSCKLIPTMLMGYFVERHRYHTREWFGAALITAGIVIFNISRLSMHNEDGHEHKRDSPYGLFLLVFSLVVDGCTNTCQSQLKIQGDNVKYRPPSALETMFWTNLYAIFLFLMGSLFSGHWINGMTAVREVEDAFKMMMQLNALAMAGQICIFFTITFYSPLMCTTIADGVVAEIA